MKYFSLILICFLLSTTAFSQKISYGKSKYYVFLDEDHAELPDKTGASYVRVFLGVDSVKTTYEVRDYTAAGRLIFIAHSSSKEFLKYEGDCTWFNSQRKVLVTGHYREKEPDGIWTTYYENGQIKAERDATPGNERLKNTWDSTGKAEVVNGNGWYISRDDTTGIIRQTGKVVNGLPDSTWTDYDKTGRKDDIIVYQKGNFVTGISYDETGKEESFKEQKTIPAFPGGEAELGRFLGRNIKYPHEDQENGKSGTVVVQFIINKDGTISKVAIHSGVTETLNRESLRVVNLMTNWIPGTLNGKKVSVLFYLPIRFTLRS
jgi:TonB family protein